ncbi:Protein of unknown function [Propionibacterium freudenreichii]|nr:Protein of unknown function [Propionibacterium freudenreichii]CEH00570.1 Protein of unknown function [Propionibacterium freudenreichii]
MKAYSMNRTGA